MKLFRFVFAAAICAPILAFAAAPPAISIVAVDPQASEAGDPATFLLTRDGENVSGALSVSLSFGGTATAGGDYANPGTSITFTPNVQLVPLKVMPVKDAIAEGTETVVVTVLPKPGAYTLAENHSATATISDAGAAAPGVPPELEAARKKLPPPDRSGTLAVTITFAGAGNWRHPSNGAYSNLKFHRELSYTVPLNGTYSAGSGFPETDRRELEGAMTPDLKRFLVAQPRDLIAAAGTPCGRGSSAILDESSGMEVGDPGQPPLVPFTQQMKGGGPYPSGDKSVPERDLCATLLSFDNQRHVLRLRLDGTDAHVKVITTHNGHSAPPFNLRLQGDAPDAKAKFTIDVPLAAGALNAEGTKTIQNVSTVTGPMNSKFPLSATVKWRVTMK